MTKRNEELERRLSRHGFRYTVDKSGDCYEYNRRGREGSWYGAVQITALEYDGLCAPESDTMPVTVIVNWPNGTILQIACREGLAGVSDEVLAAYVRLLGNVEAMAAPSGAFYSAEEL